MEKILYFDTILYMNDKFLKPYEPKDYESNIYTHWEESGFFNPDTCIQNNITSKDAEYFSIVLPPPNVTGVLHLGHAAMLAIEDSVVRFERMKGKRTLWIPGTDHAAIATQTKVEKLLQKEGLRKYDLGREEFLNRVQTFAQESHDTITSQMKAMGASVDWSREAFTLDSTREKAVHAAFKQMYEDGLIYRKEKVINWDPKGQTVISDDEIIYETRKATLYTFKYSSDFPITISTTRPETKFGDTAVAVHPSDERYAQYVGKTFDVDFAGEKLSIKIIADEHVEKDFGTGALGVTPAHSQIDYDMGIKNNLPIKQVITEFAKMQTTSELVHGLKVEEARTKTVEWLRENNLMFEEKEFEQNVSTAERTGAIIEPLPKLQWFIDVNKKFTLKKSNLTGISAGQEVSLKELMQQVVSSEQVDILPERFEKTYFHWIDNLRDWCISRQIWYGHRIPVWYRGEELVIGEDPKDPSYTQDEDTLDTWFSSALWTFSTLGWPDETDDFLNYHPTNLLETGYDIIFFWVARMILMSTYLLGEIPFKTVYLHGLVRDAKGKKISKSLGNATDPVEMIEKYGADAVRMSLLVGVGPGSDSNFSEDKVRAYKKFANKIWNATRFVLEQTSDSDVEKPAQISAQDQTSIDEFHALIEEITKEIEEYKLYLVSEKLYHYFWHTFADIIIEDCKKRIQTPTSDQDMRSAKYLLRYLLVNQLKVIHPFMPFITEEIWQTIHKDNTMLIVTKWPTNQ
jgi:valyl-tRNA synthetase